jgi:hypothetical protein
MLVLVGARVLLIIRVSGVYLGFENYNTRCALSHLPFATSFKGMRDNGGAIRFAGAALLGVCLTKLAHKARVGWMWSTARSKMRR